MPAENLTIRFGEREFNLSLDTNGKAEKIEIDGAEHKCQLKKISPSLISLLLNGKSYLFKVTRNGENYLVGWNGGDVSLEVEDDRSRLMKKLMANAGVGRHRRRVRAPMPGLVVKILTEVGAEVKKGDPLVVVEAMKMENEITAYSDGKVAEILVVEKQAVEKDAVLITLEG